MAIYHLNSKAISRAKGQSSIASAAYRSAEKLTNERTGEIADYTVKSEVSHKEIIGFEGSRSELWNLAEQSEKRKDATVAKEYEVSLPKELNREQKIKLASEFGQYLHERHKVAVDICIHKINSDNPHAHILTTTREVKNGKELGEKVAREWSDKRRKEHGLKGRKFDLIEAREQWGMSVNRALERAQIQERVDHRTLEAQGIDRKPQIHLGVTASAMEKKGIRTERGNINRDNKEQFELTKKLEIKVRETRKERHKIESKEAKINSMPNDLPALNAMRKREIDIYHHKDAMRLKSSKERLNRLTSKHEQKKQTHFKNHPERPTGMLKAFKQNAYAKAVEQWDKIKDAIDKRAAQLSKRYKILDTLRVKTRQNAEKRLDDHLPELSQKIQQAKAERAKTFKQQRTQKQNQSKSRGFGRR